MTEKSHVSIGQNFCPICNKPFDTDEILLETRVTPDGRLMQTLDKRTVTGVALCPDHQAMVDSGEYVMFYVCEERDCGGCKQFRRRAGSPSYMKADPSNCFNRPECDAQHYRSGSGSAYMHRTGLGFMMRRAVADSLFKCAVGPVNHCDRALFDRVANMLPNDETINQEGEES